MKRTQKNHGLRFYYRVPMIYRDVWFVILARYLLSTPTGSKSSRTNAPCRMGTMWPPKVPPPDAGSSRPRFPLRTCTAIPKMTQIVFWLFIHSLLAMLDRKTLQVDVTCVPRVHHTDKEYRLPSSIKSTLPWPAVLKMSRNLHFWTGLSRLRSAAGCPVPWLDSTSGASHPDPEW